MAGETRRCSALSRLSRPRLERLGNHRDDVLDLFTHYAEYDDGPAARKLVVEGRLFGQILLRRSICSGEAVWRGFRKLRVRG